MIKQRFYSRSAVVLGLLLNSACLMPSSATPESGSASLNSMSAANSPVSVAQIAPQQINLGSTVTIPVTIQSQGYLGAVTLTIDSSALAASDPMNTVSAYVLPSIVDLPASGSVQVNVTLNTLASSPDFTGAVNLIANFTGGSTVVAVPFKVNAVYEIDIMSSGNVDSTRIEDWSVPAGATVNFTQHPNGITVNFVNKDTVENSGFYRIHSTATAFPHQGGEGLGVPGSSLPSASDSTSATLVGNTVGNTYSVFVSSQTPKLTNGVYDHNNEMSSVAMRNLVFNAYTAPVAPGKSGNPNASFQYIYTNLFQAKCMSCHITNPSTSGGGINLGTYAGTLTQVQAGSAAGSPLYVQIAAGGTMPLGNPGSVSAELLQDVEDWINDGAANN